MFKFDQRLNLKHPNVNTQSQLIGLMASQRNSVTSATEQPCKHTLKEKYWGMKPQQKSLYDEVATYTQKSLKIKCLRGY